MTDAFKPLSIHGGYGNVHMNRFRICARMPRDRGAVATIGSRLLQSMPRYMAANTASVQVDDHAWNGRNTLKFRGVARIRPFSVPIPIGVGPVTIIVPVPARVRDWMAPDVHTDSVGVVDLGLRGFTVQTLKREFEDENDTTIRRAVLAAVLPLIPIPAVGVSAALLGKVVADLAVHFNQHHFLAGRRGFRFDEGSFFGYANDRVVFETVAIERFSHKVFAGSELAMGSIPAMVRAVWVDMLTKFCAAHGLEPIQDEPPGRGWEKQGRAVHCMQFEVADSVAAIQGHAEYRDMSRCHPALLEPR